MFRDIKVEGTVLDRSVEDADLETVRPHRLGGEGDPVGAVLVVLDPALHNFSGLVHHLGYDGVPTKALSQPVVVDGLDPGHGLEVADDGLQSGSTQTGEGFTGFNAPDILESVLDMLTVVSILIASENHVGILAWLG